MSKETYSNIIFKLLLKVSDGSDEAKGRIVYLKDNDQIIYSDVNMLAIEIETYIKKNHSDVWYNLQIKEALHRRSLMLAKRCNTKIIKRIKSELRKNEKTKLLNLIPEIRQLCIKETVEKALLRPNIFQPNYLEK